MFRNPLRELFSASLSLGINGALIAALVYSFGPIEPRGARTRSESTFVVYQVPAASPAVEPAKPSRSAPSQKQGAAEPTNPATPATGVQRAVQLGAPRGVRLVAATTDSSQDRLRIARPYRARRCRTGGGVRRLVSA